MPLKKCPICESKHLKRILERKAVPVLQNAVFRSYEAARSIQLGKLEMVICENCGFVFNCEFDQSLLSYTQNYDNNQSCSAHFNAHTDNLVRDLVENQGVRNCTVVEVGCGKGDFLRKLISYPESNNTGYGFDPSYTGPLSDTEGRLQFKKCHYDKDHSYIHADVVICRHVIEHIPEPLSLLRSIHSALSTSLKARLFIETPSIEWILENRVIWDFFYEHCSLFSADSLRLALNRTGFSVQKISRIFSSQYLWVEAASIAEFDSALPPNHESPSQILTLATRYAAEEKKFKQIGMERILQLKMEGKIALWGAGAKGATLAHLVDPEGCLIDCIIDQNPNKQGCFLPGTGHPIINPVHAKNYRIKNAILMNPTYRKEIQELIERKNLTLELLDLIR